MNQLFKNYIKRILAVWICSLIVSCNYTKHLSQNQTLLQENNVKLKSNYPIKYKGELESSILTLALPKPNTHLFDLGALPKYKLWKYNNHYNLYKIDTNNKKILKHKVEKPVLLDTQAVALSVSRIKQYMINQGYFYVDVQSSIEAGKKEKTANVTYDIVSGKKYLINDIDINSPSNSIASIIKYNLDKSYLVKGEIFTNYKCGYERDRLYKLIRENGFYDFKADNISFVIDTTNKVELLKLLEDPFSESSILDEESSTGRDSIDVQINIKQTKDSSFAQIYRIHDVQVEINDLNKTLSNSKDKIVESELDSIIFRYDILPVNRNVISRNIFLQKGDVFNTKNVDATINRLNQLGVFQFVNITFEKVEGQVGQLDAKIVLNTAPKMDAELRGDISTSDGDYFLGLGGSLTYRNKNLFFGANQLSVRAAYSTDFRNDSLLTGTKQFYFSGNNFSIAANLSMPKFITPFKQSMFNKKNRPYTILGVNYNIVNRVRLYTINNISGSFGYSWKETEQKNWRVNPAFLTVTRVPDQYLSTSFSEKLDSNDYLRKIFSNYIIYGENMSFEYHSKSKGEFGNFKTLKVGFEEAGTILQGVNYLYNKLTSNNIQPIANYMKLEADGRSYANRRKSQWVNRIMIGIGLPMRDNSSLPYIKQYSGGGAFSNRGWRARTLGPGRSISSAFQTNGAFVDRTGDLKLEMNTEYRMNLLKLFSGAINIKGAAFVDAGNIWLFHENENIPGGEINSKYFFNDIAMSTGLGLRFDFSFFVFRVDLGYPIKQPQLLSNSGFAFDQLNLFKSGNWNINLGYPF